jgi:hypothetical protein
MTFLETELFAAVRANYAWTYAEHHNLGTFDQRSALCAHAEWLTRKAMCVANGKVFDAPYHGSKSIIVWPTVEIHETTHEIGDSLVRSALEHEAARQFEAAQT